MSSVLQVLCELRELRVLYLHANSIWNPSDVDKLGELPHLHTITLHGNSIELQKDYRWRLLSLYPDFLPRLLVRCLAAICCHLQLKELNVISTKLVSQTAVIGLMNLSCTNVHLYCIFCVPLVHESKDVDSSLNRCLNRDQAPIKIHVLFSSA